MAHLDETEFFISEKGNYKDYLAMLGKSDPATTEALRYSLGISQNANLESAKNKIMFVGGMGVLGNLISNKGEGVIPYWRGTHDIDLLVEDKSYLHLISNSFEDLDSFNKSLSISNKYTIRGKSKDYENKELSSMVVDAYTPHDSPLKGVFFGKSLVGQEVWERSKNVNIYGIDVNVMGTLDLLKSKLDISTTNGLPRKKDFQDIYHLVGLVSEEGHNPKQASQFIGDFNKKRLENILEQAKKDSSFFKISHPRKNFIKSFFGRK
jgi:hypothetical protein